MRMIRFLFLINILVLANAPAVILSGTGSVLVVCTMLIGASWYVIFQVIPVYQKGFSIRTQVLRGGYELLWIGAVGILAEIPILCILAKQQWSREEEWITVLACAGLTLILTSVCAGNGVLRMIVASKQLSILWKLLLLFTMWIPIWNWILVWKACHIAKKEYIIESELEQRNHVRKENQVCRTKYPIVMVHGIFFRDWQLLNYWGRIPYELMRNGASVFYGNQQSALSVEQSAQEVKTYILQVIEKTGAEKVNVIAHSKGGLDVRYAISCLGMDQYVKSLTTINTPHQGCKWAEEVLQKLPQGLIQWVARKYHAIFCKLGDQTADFIAAVEDLTVRRSEELAQKMPDKEQVYYQSVMSVMKKRNSAGFPLNMVYPIVKKAEGENDGLVGMDSAQWGTFLGVLQTKGRRGISHGDMIDLMRENISGFDVREYYVWLVSELKKKGF